MGYRDHIMEKIYVLIGIHYQLCDHRNGANYVKSLQTGWTFFDPNPNKVYDMTSVFLQLILPIISSRKLADLPRQ